MPVRLFFSADPLGSLLEDFEDLWLCGPRDRLKSVGDQNCVARVKQRNRKACLPAGRRVTPAFYVGAEAPTS